MFSRNTERILGTGEFLGGHGEKTIGRPYIVKQFNDFLIIQVKLINEDIYCSNTDGSFDKVKDYLLNTLNYNKLLQDDSYFSYDNDPFIQLYKVIYKYCNSYHYIKTRSYDFKRYKKDGIVIGYIFEVGMKNFTV